MLVCSHVVVQTLLHLMPAHGRRHVAGVGDAADIEGRLLMPILNRAIHFYRPQRPDTPLLPLSNTQTGLIHGPAATRGAAAVPTGRGHTADAVRDIEVDGHLVEAGNILVVGIYALHRDPALWNHPLVFDSDRFSPQNSDGRDRWQ